MIAMMPPTNGIYRKAADWSARADGESFSADQQAALDAWLDEDPRHLGAYLAVRASLAKVERLAKSHPDRNARPEKLTPVRTQSRKRFVLVGAIAASFALVVVSGAVWNANSNEATYATVVGQTKAVRLLDGSAITLNTGTVVTVHYDPLHRDIALQRGEALFDVAKNKLRPFLVKAGQVQVRAVGTSFSVTALNDRPLQVMVREGVVEVKAARTSNALAVVAGTRAIGLANGQFVVEHLPVGQIARDLAWRDGYIFFRRQTLADAAQEFARYSKLRIVIDDAAVASKTVTGRYVSTDPVGFAKAVAVFWELKAVVTPEGVHLMPKKS